MGQGEHSLHNEGEAELLLAHARALLERGLPPRELALVSPYRAQAALLRERLGNPEVEVDTVDAFQGREKEAVLVSLVRSNPKGQVGFLADLRRMNVALTRPPPCAQTPSTPGWSSTPRPPPPTAPRGRRVAEQAEIRAAQAALEYWR